MAIDDDILSPERVADPYPYFAAVRAEGAEQQRGAEREEQDDGV